MSEDELPHESIRALRARGGHPIDLPDALLLGEVAGYDRALARDRVLAHAEASVAALDPFPSPEDEAWAMWNRWVIELLTDDDLADWFLAGLPAEFVEAQRAAVAHDRDIAQRPLDAQVIQVDAPFRCAISGATDDTHALALTSRDDPQAPPTLLGLHALTRALGSAEHGARPLPRPPGTDRRCPR